MAERLKVLLDDFESNMTKKMEENEPIPLQPVHEISETKEQIKKPLVIEAKGQQILKAEGIDGTQVESLGLSVKMGC
ncbi:hypothetical protein FH972_015165 [Carpinus fangiana]|uniref:Uncharacterized protein n=1 Tax=Carpinus fangiana TaxID=176857 RepID=A0A5N6RCI1_9ROSI|nr:hypothetical protein FH972_015165 [Carpinus fangiana]